MELGTGPDVQLVIAASLDDLCLAGSGMAKAATSLVFSLVDIPILGAR
jgi:hypothetical protein